MLAVIVAATCSSTARATLDNACDMSTVLVILIVVPFALVLVFACLAALIAYDDRQWERRYGSARARAAQIEHVNRTLHDTKGS